MTINQIQKIFRYSFKSILHAKFRNFFKRSIWKYFITSLLLVSGIYLLDSRSEKSFLSTLIIIYPAMIVLSITLMIISSYSLFLKKRQEDMSIVFSEKEIEVNMCYFNTKEIKDWDWIKSVEEVNGIYYLDIDVKPRNVIMITKGSLSGEEIDTFQQWFKVNNKLKV